MTDNAKKRAEWFPESAVSDMLLPGETMRDTIRDIRQKHLALDKDFRIHGREIVYSKAGVEKLAKLLKVGQVHPEKDAPPPESPTAPPPLDPAQAQGQGEKDAPALQQPAPATVKRVWPNNPHYFMATLDGEDITVCVRDTRNFAIGMKIDRAMLKKRGPFSQIHDFIGRCPRGRGRW